MSIVLFNGLGVGAYYVLVSLVIADAVLLARRGINLPLVRLAGWILSLVGVTTLAAMALPGFARCPIIGPGGYLGAAGRGLLERHFASIGAYIIVGSLILGGLLMSTDYMILRILAWIVGIPMQGASRKTVQACLAATGKAASKSKRRLSDLDGPASDLDAQKPNDPAREIPVTSPAGGSAKKKGKAGTKPRPRRRRTTA